MERLVLLQDRGRALRIAPIPGAGGVFDFVDFNSPAEARDFLRRQLGCETSMQGLRRALAEEGTSASAVRLSDDAVLEQVSWRIWMGRIGVAQELRRPLHPFTSLDVVQEAQAPPAAASVEKKLTWIEIQFFDDRTARPVPSLRIVVRTPDGNESFQTTDAQGLIRLDDLNPGTCDARSEIKGATLEDTLAYVGDGQPSHAPADAAAADRPPPKIWHFAQVERHQVKTGETLDALAKKAAMSWQDLAKFNWGTDVPDQINIKLRDEVGCTKKTADGANYIFDDSDKPGIVFIPGKWENDGLPTGQRHIFRGKKLTRFFVILENDEQLRIPETSWEANLADGSSVSGKLGVGGVDAIDDPPEGDVAVFFPDLDDIEAKSLAASARKAFDARDPTELHRLFRYPVETIQRAIEAYDKYFNTYRKKGLRGDIKEEFDSDEDAQAIFFAYFLRVDAPPPEEPSNEILWSME